MIITRETDYALRVLRALKEGGRMQASAISKNHQIPEAYFYKIVQKLAQGQLVKNTRGRNGGIELMADLDKVTLFDVIQLMENGCSLCACGLPDYECAWVKAHTDCVIHKKLMELQSELYDKMASVSISDIV